MIFASSSTAVLLPGAVPAPGWLVICTLFFRLQLDGINEQCHRPPAGSVSCHNVQAKGTRHASMQMIPGPACSVHSSHKKGGRSLSALLVQPSPAGESAQLHSQEAWNQAPLTNCDWMPRTAESASEFCNTLCGTAPRHEADVLSASMPSVSHLQLSQCANKLATST